jgi:hypothetical protein
MEKTQQMVLQQRGKAICWERISLDLAGVRILKVGNGMFWDQSNDAALGKNGSCCRWR